MSLEFSTTMANDMADLGRLPPEIEAFAERADLPADVAMHIDLVLDELLVNTISYGFPDGRPGKITVRMRVEDDVVIVIEDDGDAFDPLGAPPPDVESDLENRPVGGLGVHLVRTMMDSVDYQRIDGINRLTLTKQLPRSGQHHASNT
ncbi:ATP-binding protein [Emcibacter sp. SYSU 3D8]|uniref:ATP-binding protein n=1 Tax=Emcibacter sp. SYSU 3D8 TaxID=3133969 RepID=UPI0031FEAC4D